MIKLYREIGFELKYLEDNLIKFDCYCDEHDYKNINLSEQFAEEWIYSYKTNSKQQLAKRVRTIKYLGKYLNSIGIQAYIPKYSIKSDPPKPPTLPTNDELLTIFQAIVLMLVHIQSQYFLQYRNTFDSIVVYIGFDYERK